MFINCNALVNHYRVAIAIELEPVDAVYRLQCAKWDAVETKYFNGCEWNSSNRKPTQMQWRE